MKFIRLILSMMLLLFLFIPTMASAVEPIPPQLLPKRTDCYADSKFSVAFPASQACDGNVATGWFSGTTGFPHWIIFNLTAESSLSFVAFVQANAGGETMRVDIWDGSSWITKVPLANMQGTNNTLLLMNNTNTNTKAFRFVFTASGGAAPGVMEVYAYGYPRVSAPTQPSTGFIVLIFLLVFALVILAYLALVTDNMFLLMVAGAVSFALAFTIFDALANIIAAIVFVGIGILLLVIPLRSFERGKT